MKTVILIGGTGTLGTYILPYLLMNQEIHRIRIISRNEHRQAEMEREFAGERVDFLLGDVADKDRIERACRGCEEVYHFAAIKRVEKAEYDPDQAVRTNVVGTMNVISACIKNQVVKAIFTSTDKACNPFNSYGASKLLAENLFIAGNIGSHSTRFSVVRYGNVMGSQGSVINLWRNQKEITITDPEMTRFWISKDNAAAFVYNRMKEMDGGEIFFPKMKSSTIGHLSECFDKPFKLVGRRQGEKIHEYLISKDETHLVYERDNCYVRYPEYKKFPFEIKGRPADLPNGYSSEMADRFTHLELMELCQSC